jgi:hypothetical protein
MSSSRGALSLGLAFGYRRLDGWMGWDNFAIHGLNCIELASTDKKASIRFAEINQLVNPEKIKLP